MRKVKDHINDKLKKDPNFKKRYGLILQKAAVAKKIINYRIEHNLTQAQLADEVGVSQQYISRIEEGHFSTFDMVETILHHIGYRLRIESIPA